MSVVVRSANKRLFAERKATIATVIDGPLLTLQPAALQLLEFLLKLLRSAGRGESEVAVVLDRVRIFDQSRIFARRSGFGIDVPAQNARRSLATCIYFVVAELVGRFT